MAAAPSPSITDSGTDRPTKQNWKSILAPTRRERLVMRGLVTLGLLALGLFLYWFLDKDFIGFAPLYWLLAVAFGYKILRVLHEWYHYVGIRVPERPVLTRDYTVDMLTTFCAGEPYEMVLETLEAMVKVRYPHTTYLCDESNDPYLKQKCAELGVVHVYRGPVKSHAKAGNINYALEHHARGEIAIILDPDHKPVPAFIDRVLPFFEREEIGYVQCVQAYKNRNESFIAKAAAQQTYHFYGPMMMSMNSYGTVQAIGANCSFRRAALDSIGGHAPGLSEDMHTAMRLHAKGWQSVYVPEALSRGLVPATLSGYYKQQLKWSRGTFELLFRVLPKLARHLNWRQMVHYLTIPLFFLSGLIALIDITVPILALVMAKSPWYVELSEMAQYSLPLITMIVLIRQYAQHWTLEEHEGGFHFLGGALLFGSWWVTLTGFVYAIFNVNVPYIPTPKDDALVNEWRITRPNMVAIGLSIAAIAYGLSIDWSPYSFIMAGFAGVNIFMLGFLTLISQQKLIGGLYRRMYQEGQSRLRMARRQLYFLRHRFLYRAMRNRWVLSFMIFAAVLLSLSLVDQTPRVDLGKGIQNTRKVREVFFVGIQSADRSVDTLLTRVQQVEHQLRLPVHLLSLSEPVVSLAEYGPTLAPLINQGYLPMVSWIPVGSGQDLCQQIAAGQHDSLLRAEAQAIRALNGTVFLEIAPEAEWQDHAWSTRQGNQPDAYVAAWQRVVKVFQGQGVPNVVWVWRQVPSDSLKRYYPGSRYVDYVSLGLLDRLGQGQLFPSLDSLYLPIRNQGYPHPVILNGFRAPTLNQSKWLRTAFEAMQLRYDEIQGLVFQSPRELIGGTTQSNGELLGQSRAELETLRIYLQDMEQPSDTRWDMGNWLPQARLTRSGPARQLTPPLAPPVKAPSHPQPYIRPDQAGGFQWVVRGEPCQIRGVVYNPAQDWRDGHTPLTRNKLTRDFARIQAMGGNTISRYRPGIYDQNLLRAADDKGMNVQYGFWFEPWIDYYADTATVNRIIEEVVGRVEEEKVHPAIIGWGLGTETWQRLSYHFHPAYLFQVRRSYLMMLEKIATRIHAIDSTRPVYTNLSADETLPAALHMLRRHAPSVDFPGLNAMYTHQLAGLDSLMQMQWADRPYFVAEFGPEGHWDERYTPLDNEGFLQEPSDYEKAAQLRDKWTRYLQPGQSHGMGALAYCWQDRFEGTQTWFGLTDQENRLKPGYYALRNVWTGAEMNMPLADVYLQSPLDIPAPRKVLNFRAISPNNLNQDLTYEWKLVKQHSYETVGTLDIKRKYHLALVDLPLPPGGYRLYLSVSDGEGNVVTASEGFPVYDIYNGN
jgi:hypothetical protein